MMFPITNSVSPTMNRQVIDRLSIVGRNPNVPSFVINGIGGTAGITYQSSASPNLLIQAQNVAHVPLVVKGLTSHANAFFEIQRANGISLLSYTGEGLNWTLNVRSPNADQHASTCYKCNAVTGSVGLQTDRINNSVAVLSMTCNEDVGGTSNSGLHWCSNINTLTLGRGWPYIATGEMKSSLGATAPNATIKAMSANGTNATGSNLIFAPGQASGSGTPSSVIIQGTAAGASGSTAQALVDVLTITNANLITFSDAVNVNLNATIGTKWGRVTDKQAWFGATPVVQPAHANQAAVTDSTTGVASFTLNDVGAVFSQSTSNGNFATLAKQINEIRNVLVTLGKMKGSA